MLRVESLREVMRRSTRDLHDALDSLLAPLADGDRYVGFLAVQYAARMPIEAWFDRESEILQPPSQTRILADDLEVLGADLPVPQARFLPRSNAEAIGIAWVLAGSSLGNKVILRRRRAYDGGRATSFLSNNAMPRFWDELRPRLERQSDEWHEEQAVSGARRTFDHFLSSAAGMAPRLAA